MNTANMKIAIATYESGEVSLGKATELAGLSVDEMMTALEGHGVTSNLEVEDYLEELENGTFRLRVSF